MQNQNKFQAKAFDLLRLMRIKYKLVTKMLPLSDKLWDTLQLPFTFNNMLSMGRVTKLAERVKFTKSFFAFILKYKQDHGAEATVKWLKAALVAVQKELGQDRLASLQTLGAALPYSRLSSGLPRIIPSKQRAMIRRGDVKEIRFWTGLLNLYRVLECPGKLKISTITDPFSGNTRVLNIMINKVTNPRGLFFDTIPGFLDITRVSLDPKEFYLSRAASPSNKQSYHGILTDLWYLSNCQPQLWKALLDYLAVVDRYTENAEPFAMTLLSLSDYINRLMKYAGSHFEGKSGTKYHIPSPLAEKDSIRIHGNNPWIGQGLSQFALKIEAAGKIRLFALMDSITQSVLSPLHDMLYNLLRSIPNDGTFDQEASIKRSQVKALKANMAFSFDLTAATDRLPSKLTAQIIAGISGLDIAVYWWRIMTDRNFFFNQKVADKYEISSGPYRYSVGQPMGGLSSWAGLAVTHHWIVQLAASRVTGSYTWNESYEILGDDLVIFDEAIAKEYLVIMSDLGCEINLHKSIVSKSRPVFEFAKRTCWGNHIVSGISIAQVQAGWNVGGRINNAYAWFNSGLITSLPLLVMALSRNIVNNRKLVPISFFQSGSSYGITKNLSLGILGLLGSLHVNEKLTLKDLMQAIINPSKGHIDFSSETVGLPMRTSLKGVFDTLMSSTQRPYNALKFPKFRDREDIFEENKTSLSMTMLYNIRNLSQDLLDNYKGYVAIYADSLIGLRPRLATFILNESEIAAAPEDINSDIPDELATIYSELNDKAEMILGLHATEKHPEYAHYIIQNYISKTCVDMEGVLWLDWAPDDKVYHELVEISAWLEALQFRLKPSEVAGPKTTVVESAPILKTLRKMDLTKQYFGSNYVHR